MVAAPVAAPSCESLRITSSDELVSAGGNRGLKA
jgi:hypothetical protein